jgi:hypothetical protein
LGTGLVYVFQVMPEEHRPRLFEELVSSCLTRLEQGARLVDAQHPSYSLATLSQLSDEIRLLSGLASAFSDAASQEDVNMENGATTSPYAPPVPAHVIATIRKGRPAIGHLAKHFSDDEVRLFRGNHAAKS